jgi:predicted nuclease of predicted toxin-antitoxin system
MKLLVDMNLSPAWCSLFQAAGWDAAHWSTVGNPAAPDHELLHWARSNERVVFTHDLDFSAILAATGATGPSVIQVRTQDVRPSSLGPRLIVWLRQYTSQLETGAIVVIDEARSRIRLLPIRKS